MNKERWFSISVREIQRHPEYGRYFTDIWARYETAAKQIEERWRSGEDVWHDEVMQIVDNVHERWHRRLLKQLREAGQDTDFWQLDDRLLWLAYWLPTVY